MTFLCALGIHRWTKWLHIYWDPDTQSEKEELIHACRHCGKPRKKIK